jgi:ketosteroid isomerase-like protein
MASSSSATGPAGKGDRWTREVLVMHLREGKIVEVWEMYDDQQAYDEFWY